MGTDHTLFATSHGTVEFRVKGPEQRTYVNVVAK
jgi:ribosomal protein L27